MPPPPPHATDDPDNWTPYNSQLEFETAKFLFTCEQMSAGNIDILLDLWSTSLFKHSEQPPFTSHCDLYDTIDVTLGNVPWENFSVCYNGIRPEGDIPSWMDTGHKVWYHNPHTLIHNILSNPDFDREFDYAPLQEHDMHGNHQFKNFMSGNCRVFSHFTGGWPATCHDNVRWLMTTCHWLPFYQFAIADQSAGLSNNFPWLTNWLCF